MDAHRIYVVGSVLTRAEASAGITSTIPIQTSDIPVIFVFSKVHCQRVSLTAFFIIASHRFPCNPKSIQAASREALQSCMPTNAVVIDSVSLNH